MLYHLLAVMMLSHLTSVWVDTTPFHSLGYHKLEGFSSHKAVPTGAQWEHCNRWLFYAELKAGGQF